MVVPSFFDEARKTILATSREIYGRLVYSHKVHEIQKDLIQDRISCVKWLRVITAGLTFVFAALTFAPFSEAWIQAVQVAATLFGALSAAQAVFEKEFVSEKEVSLQRQAAKELLIIRERFLLLIVKCYEQTNSNKNLQDELSKLTEELTHTYSLAPETSPKAYTRAQVALKNKEAMTFSDKEIDYFLPPQLRVDP